MALRLVRLMQGVVHHAIKRFGSPPAAIPRRATRRVATRQMPQAYPPQRGMGKRAAKENVRTASLAVVMTEPLPSQPPAEPCAQEEGDAMQSAVYTVRLYGWERLL